MAILKNIENVMIEILKKRGDYEKFETAVRIIFSKKYYKEVRMKKKRKYLILLLLLLFTFSFAQETKDQIVPVAGLEVYTLDNTQQTHVNSNEFISRYRFISMKDFGGYGIEVLFSNNTYLNYGLHFNDLVNEEKGADWKFTEYINHFDCFVGKTFQFTDFLNLKVTHNFNLVLYYWEEEYETFWFVDEYDGGDENFSPSIETSLQLKIDISEYICLDYTISEQFWYTSPEFKLEYFNRKMTDIYEGMQYSFGISAKF